VPKVIPAFVISCAAIVTALGDIACSGSSHPAIVTPSIVTPSTIAIPTSLPLSVTEVSAGRGSAGGGTRLKIRGSNLTRGASVTFGNVKVSSNGYDPRDEPNTSLLITSPPHPAGVVDLVITTPDGILRLNEAFEFVDQEAFDFNGTWSGFTIDGSDVGIAFVIQNNTLVGGSCEGYTKKVALRSTDVTAGSFLATGPDGFQLTGRIVSAAQATGKVTAPDCSGAGESPWQVYKVD